MTARQFFATRAEPSALEIEILRPVGSLADDAVLQELDLLLNELRTRQPRAVIINFRQVAYFGSSLLEALRVLWKEVQATGGRMVLCNLSPVGREIVELAKFDHVWSIVDTLAEARQRLA
jgi:anti-anti-sigma factor